jgi:hypothetical protein
MRNSKQTWSVILFIIFLAAIGCTVYFWATGYVWIPVIVVSFYFFYCDLRREEYLPYHYSWHLQGITYGTGAVSTIWQYFFTTIIWEFQLWECLLGVSVVGILLALTIGSIGGNRARRRQRRREARERRLYEKQIEVIDAAS